MKIKISAVSYLNTKPFLAGLQDDPVMDNIDLQLDIPSICAGKLKSGEVDLALAPVAIIPALKEAHIISDYCIGTEGAVKTVCIYSQVPLEEVQQVYLDYQSRTSVALVQVLLKEYWNKRVEFLEAKEGFENKIEGNKAGVIIGDRAYTSDYHFRYAYDLGAAWMDHTNLPFVFAAWITNKVLPAEFISQFNIALKKGIHKIDEVAQNLQPDFPDTFEVKDYLKNNISYELTSEKRAGLDLFLSKIRSMQLHPVQK